MQTFTLDPMLDPRWEDLVATHSSASVFHHKGWLTALARTYGYRPIVLTTTPPEKPLLDGIAFCEVHSRLTGNRLVSLPFADHASPLLGAPGSCFNLSAWMQTELRERRWKYIELRPLCADMQDDSPLTPSQSFWFHDLDLTPPLEVIFRNMDRNSIQRRIHHAERAHLTYQRGCSKQTLDYFYRLLIITRRRHQLLPQPLIWFRNLLDSMNGAAEIRVASNHGVPIAALFTLRHRNSVVYKYGCSDHRFHHLAGMPFLFWKLIEESKAEGANHLDFGRTDLDNDGLVRFKDQFGTARRQITYLRYPGAAPGQWRALSAMPAVRRLFSILPDALASTGGRLLYRHLG